MYQSGGCVFNHVWPWISDEHQVSSPNLHKLSVAVAPKQWKSMEFLAFFLSFDSKFSQLSKFIHLYRTEAETSETYISKCATKTKSYLQDTS